MYNPPLDIKWSGSDTAVVSKGGVERGRFVARRTLLTDDRYVQPGGNSKSAHVMGMIKGLSQWCGRSLTGFERCDVPCYSNDDGSGGCFANHTCHSRFLRSRGYDVIHNGFKPGTEDWGYIQLPKYDSYDLSPARARVGRDRMIWRVDSETSDVSASLALGMMQRWAEENPRDWFVAISSNYYRVPLAMLKRAARLPNLIVGHTFSPWFRHDDSLNRLASLRHYIEVGVRTQLWIATRPSWDVSPSVRAVIDEAVSLVDPKQVIEVAYHDLQVGHERTSFNLNPLGVCCEGMVDMSGRKVKNGMVRENGTMVPVKGRVVGKCSAGCKLLCGVSYETLNRRESSKHPPTTIV